MCQAADSQQIFKRNLKAETGKPKEHRHLAGEP